MEIANLVLIIIALIGQGCIIYGLIRFHQRIDTLEDAVNDLLDYRSRSIEKLKPFRNDIGLFGRREK